MLCMTLGESLTGIGYAQKAKRAAHVLPDSLYESYRGFVSYRFQYRESVGIEMLHRNLLVMERTYISLSLSVQG